MTLLNISQIQFPSGFPCQSEEMMVFPMALKVPPKLAHPYHPSYPTQPPVCSLLLCSHLHLYHTQSASLHAILGTLQVLSHLRDLIISIPSTWNVLHHIAWSLPTSAPLSLLKHHLLTKAFLVHSFKISVDSPPSALYSLSLPCFSL